MRSIKLFIILLIASAFSSSFAGAASSNKSLENQEAMIQATKICDLEAFHLISERKKFDATEFSSSELFVGGVSPLTSAVHSYITSRVRNESNCLAIVSELLKAKANPLITGGQSYPNVFYLISRGAVAAGWGEANALIPDRLKVLLKILSDAGYDFRKILYPLQKEKLKGLQASRDKDFFLDKSLLMIMSTWNGNGLSYMESKSYRDFYDYVLAESNVNLQNSQGKTALIYAAILGSNVISSAAMVKTLIENGAKTDIRDRLGKTALDYAMGNGDIQAAKLLAAK